MPLDRRLWQPSSSQAVQTKRAAAPGHSRGSEPGTRNLLRRQFEVVRLRLRGGALLGDKLRIELVELVQCSRLFAEVQILKRHLDHSPTGEMDLVMLDGELVYRLSLLEHRRRQGREVDSG